MLFREVEGHKGTLKNAVNLLNAKLERPKCNTSKTEARREILLYVTVVDGGSKDGSRLHVHCPHRRRPSF